METNFDFCAELANHLIRECKNDCERKCLLKSCADFHYEVNQMDHMLDPYVGDLEGFISFLEDTLGWVITRSEDGKTILADENKPFCVCPIAANTQEAISPLFCDCSTFYAQKMFARVCGQEVKASLKRSVLRDGKSCIYEITLC